MSAALALRGWVARSTPTLLWWWRRPQSLLRRLGSPTDEMVRVLLEESALGVAIVDRNGRLVRVNQALRGLLSLDCKLAPGQPVQDIFCDKRRPAVWDELRPVLRGRNTLRSYVSVVRGRRDGGVQPVEVSVRPLREANATVSGAILQFVDILTQTELEAQLSHGQKLQAVGQLAGGIAHDFNNLLTAVIGAADETLHRAHWDDAAIEDLQQIRHSATRGADLVRQLLAFSRQQSLQPRAIIINHAIDHIAVLLRRLLGSTVALELELEQPGRTVRVDPTQLDQVLVNLAVNARDAMPNGGRLTLRTGHMDLFRPLVRDTETIPPGHYVMVEVQDTGVGIPRDVLPRIFEPFFTTRRERGGNGLGLSTVHGIVRQSDGFVAVDSAPGKGTRVRIYLPRLAEQPPCCILPPPSAPPVPAMTATQPGTILLVDDEDGIRRVAARALTRRGWTVLPAESGEHALVMLADPAVAADVTAVVSDLAMPGLDGAALIEAVRAIRPSLPAILVSGYAEDTLRRRLAEADIQFMAKPYAMRDLIAAVETKLQRAAALPSQALPPLAPANEPPTTMLSTQTCIGRPGP